MRGLAASSKNYLEMDKRAGKLKQGYVYFPRDILKPISLIHGNGKSSKQYKVVDYFGTRYAASRIFK